MGDEEIRVDIYGGNISVAYFDGASVVETRTGLNSSQFAEYASSKSGNPRPKFVSCPGLAETLVEREWRERIAEINNTWRE